MKTKKLWLILSLILQTIFCQANTGGEEDKNEKKDSIGFSHQRVYTIDFNTGMISPEGLPFDVPFIITGMVPKEVIAVKLAYRSYKNPDKLNIDEGCCDDTVSSVKLCSWKRNMFTKDNDSGMFFIEVPPLAPNKYYKFDFTFTRLPDSSELKKFSDHFEMTMWNKWNSNYYNLLSNKDAQKSLMQEVKKSTDRYVFDYYQRKNLEIGQPEFDKHTVESIFNEVEFSVLMDNYKENWASFQDQNRLNVMLGKLQAITQNPFLSEALKEGPDTLFADSVKTAFTGLLDLRTRNPLFQAGIIRGITELFSEEDAAIALDSSAENNVTVLNILRRNLLKSQSKFSSLRKYLSAHCRFNPKKFASVVKNKMESNLTLLLVQLDEIDVEFRTVITFLDRMLLMRKQAISCFQYEEYIKEIVRVRVPVYLTSNADFVTRSEWYLTFDAGVAAYMMSNKTFGNNYNVVPYFGVNFNLRPLNRQKHYSLCDFRSLCQTVSLTLGVTATSVENDDFGVKNLFNGYTLVSGIGIRLSDYIRLSAGSIWMKKKTSYPLKDIYNLHPYGYIALSIDLDIYRHYEKIRNDYFKFNK